MEIEKKKWDNNVANDWDRPALRGGRGRVPQRPVPQRRRVRRPDRRLQVHLPARLHRPPVRGTLRRRVLPSFTEFCRVFTEFYRVLPSFTEFYLVLLGFT